MNFSKLFRDVAEKVTEACESLADSLKSDTGSSLENRFNISTGKIETIFSGGGNDFIPRVNLTTGKVEIGQMIDLCGRMQLNPMTGQMSYKL